MAAFSHGLEEVVEHMLRQSLPHPSTMSLHHLAADPHRDRALDPVHTQPLVQPATDTLLLRDVDQRLKDAVTRYHVPCLHPANFCRTDRPVDFMSCL